LDYALYLKGLANFNDNLGLLGRLARKDLSESDQKAAKESFETFKELASRFPESKYAPDARARDSAVRFELLARADTVADLRGFGGGGRWPPRIIGLEPSACTTDSRSEASIPALIDEARGLPDAPAGTQRAAAKADAIAAAEGMSESIRLVRADIVARIAQRINQSLCAPLMILLGAVLAIRLRGTNPLQVYLLSFIPAIIDILLISGGEQMLKEATTVTGLFVVSSGNIGLVVMIAVAYRQIARN
ncbi:MAG: tetratricopeptide repeat protein, partial [bacterium]